MAQATDLMNVGESWLEASLVGYVSGAVTGAGTTSANSTLLNSQITYVILTVTGSDGVRMAADTPLLRPIMVVNGTGSNGKVYPHTGGTVNGGSTDAGETIGTTTAQIWVRQSATAWSAFLGA